MRFLMCVVVPLVMVAVPTAANASGRNDGGEDQPAVISVGVQYGAAPAGVTGKDSHQCFWTPAGAASTTEAPVVDRRVVDGAVQNLFVRSCPGSLDLIWVAQASPRVLGRLATDMAKALVPKPSFGSAPVADTGVVNVDMWLWTDPGDYGVVRTREVWVPTPTGPITAQAIATPVHLVFTPGEPGSVPFACDGPGQPWEPAFGEDSKSACTYRYLHSSEISESGKFSALWSIVWSIKWYSNHAVGETLPAFVTTTAQEITVKEIQAVIVG